jgi:tetratricopeptide (TPR) repeat protein
MMTCRHRCALALSRAAWRWAIAVAVALSAATALAQSAAPLSHNVYDEEAIRVLRRSRPQEAELLERGEALAHSGDLPGALAVFRQGASEDSDQPLFPRRICEVLVAMGNTTEGVAACFRALERSDSSVNVRATVRALVSAPSGPTLQQLTMALMLANKEVRRAPRIFNTVAAMCDIAERIGDGVMLEHCAEDLGHVAPDSPETRRALSMLAARCPPGRFWLGWAAILAAFAATLAHASWHALRGRRSSAGVAMAAALLFAAGAMSESSALADEAPDPARSAEAHPQGTPQAHGWLSKWPIDDNDPKAHIPTEAQRNADPLEFGYWLQDLALKAELASKKGDHPASIRFWSALAKAVPDRAIALTRACDEYEAMGDRESAISACGAALMRDGLMVKDYTHYVHLLIGKAGPLKPEEIASLSEVIDHMKEDPEGRNAALELECEVGTRTNNVGQLEECTTYLAKSAPNAPKTLTYQWALAMMKGQTDEARRLLQQAKEAGLQPEAVDRMQKAVSAQSLGRWRVPLMTLGAVVAAAGALAFAVSRLRRRGAPHPA